MIVTMTFLKKFRVRECLNSVMQQLATCRFSVAGRHLRVFFSVQKYETLDCDVVDEMSDLKKKVFLRRVILNFNLLL